LTWDHQHKQVLLETISNIQIEPHPVSGDLELGNVKIQYRRLDAETLQSRLSVELFKLTPIYVWCEDDTQDDSSTSSGWKLAELRTDESGDRMENWYETIAEANGSENEPHPSNTAEDKLDDGEDDYWASYDQTPGRTPGRRQSPPPSSSAATRLPSTTLPEQQRSRIDQPAPSNEDEYYKRYASVQPALDDHDPDEEASIRDIGHPFSTHQPVGASVIDCHQALSLTPLHTLSRDTSTNVSDLEASVSNHGAMPTPVDGVKQYISTQLQQLMILSQSVGLGRDAFINMMRSELDSL